MVGLRHFDADGPATDHDKMIGEVAVGEDRLVCQVGNAVKTRYRRDRRLRAGGDDEPAGPDLDLAGAERPRAGEACFGTDYLYPEPLEALRGVVRGDCRDDLLHAVGHIAKVDQRRAGGDAERRAAPRKVGMASGCEKRLRRHAAEIEAVPAHRAALDQHDFGAHLSCAGGDRQAAGAGSDDA